MLRRAAGHLLAGLYRDKALHRLARDGSEGDENHPGLLDGEA